MGWSSELGLFVAVSQTGTNRVMTSPDGINWTSRSASEANAWISVQWSAQLGLFIAIAASGTNRIMSSADGINWFPVLASEANTWVGLVWSPELMMFVATSTSGTNRVMNSPSFGIPGNNFTSYGQGTSYVLTNTSALLDFGLADPAPVIAQAGTYLLMGQAQLAYSGALVTGESVALKIRRTSPNAADIPSSLITLNLPTGSGMNYTYGTFSIPPLIYQTTGRSDVLSLYGNVSSTLGLGGVIAQSSGTSLIAVRLY